MRRAKTKAQALYGLTHDPFQPDVPLDSCFLTPDNKHFLWRVEQLVGPGGFALIIGEPGEGKSVLLRLLRDRLGKMSDVHVGILTRPQASVADFYRELGSIYKVALKPHNRWQGSEDLRTCWQTHIEAVLMRPVLLIDEAQEMSSDLFNELRLLCSSSLDSQLLLTVVIAGDARLLARLRTPDLAPNFSRIRTRVQLEPLSPERLKEILTHLIREAGNPRLMTPGLIDTVCERAYGNLRTLTHICADLLAAGAERDAQQLDETLFLELFGTPDSPLGVALPERADRRRRKAR